MRLIAGLVTGLCTAVLCQAAEPPAPAAQPPATSAATSSADSSAAPPGNAPAAQANAAASASDANTIKPPVTVVGTKAELSPPEKELISRGYKLKVRNGQKYFCIIEQKMGSRFESETCDTSDSIEAHRQASQEAIRAIQADRSKSSN
jgi:hypothetical protein